MRLAHDAGHIPAPPQCTRLLKWCLAGTAGLAGCPEGSISITGYTARVSGSGWQRVSDEVSDEVSGSEMSGSGCQARCPAVCKKNQKKCSLYRKTPYFCRRYEKNVFAIYESACLSVSSGGEVCCKYPPPIVIRYQ